MSDLATHSHGFLWGPLNVTRIAHWSPRKGRESYVVEVSTDHVELNIYVSKTGRSVRVFRDGKEIR